MKYFVSISQISPTPRSYKESQRVIQLKTNWCRNLGNSETGTILKIFWGENVVESIATKYKCKLHNTITSIRMSFL